MSKCIVKCNRCKKKYEGASLDEAIVKNNLQKDGAGYKCDCGDQFAAAVSKQKSKIIESFMGDK